MKRTTIEQVMWKDCKSTLVLRNLAFTQLQSRIADIMQAISLGALTKHSTRLLFVQGAKHVSISDRLKQNVADAKKRRCDANGSTSASRRLKPFNEQDISIAMNHATSAAFAEQGITHMQFARAVANKTRIADTILSVKRFQYHEQWAKML
jgi:hypothetical protein